MTELKNRCRNNIYYNSTATNEGISHNIKSFSSFFKIPKLSVFIFLKLLLRK